jgi:3-oxoacyl-[acyl-carrier protein] reductase
LSEAHAKVAICARNAAGLSETAVAIENRTGHRVLPLVADVTVPADVERLVQEVQVSMGGIDILVNDAGAAGPSGTFGDLVKAVLPTMKARQWGRIINIFTENGLQPDPDRTPYDLTKAVIAFLASQHATFVIGTDIKYYRL